MNKIQQGLISKVLCYSIHEKCMDFAIKQMTSNDFILIEDAGNKTTEGVQVERNGVDGLFTIKNSCKDKYLNLYANKLEHLIENIMKDR